jgi:hypothetical protein
MRRCLSNPTLLTMATDFSAGAQALGYLHQVRYSLYSLLVSQRGNTELYVEELDDVVRQSPGVTELDQLKHHTTPDATINEYSTELWRTLRGWFTYFDQGRIKPESAMLCLITTATAQAGSAPAKLCQGSANRDVTAARERLVAVAQAAGSDSHSKFYRAFLKVGNTDQVRSTVDLDRVLSAVVVIDNAPTIDQVTPKIMPLLVGVHASNLEALYTRLEGWWFNKIIAHLLTKSAHPITRYEVSEMIADINEQFRPSSLPIDYEFYEPTDQQHADSTQRRFVQQLSAVNIAGMRLQDAVLDFYRAFEQRSKWVQETLLIDDELLVYEQRLVQAWRRQVGFLQSRLPQSDDIEQVAFGMNLLDWMEQQAGIPIRPDMPAGHEYMMRGSFHWLADKAQPRVYWHPKFLEKLAALLQPA